MTFEQGSRTKVVLDTNIVVSALLTCEGNPAAIFDLFLLGKLVLVYSDDIMAEYVNVLYRPRLRISVNEIGTALSAIRQHGRKTKPAISTEFMLDSDDRPFYDAAVSAGAYLITGNAKHFPVAPFIVSPARFIELRRE